MSIQTLSSPNDHNIYCNNLTVAGTLTTGNGPVAEHQTISLPFSGPWASAQNGTVHLSRTGSAVNITCDSVTAAATTAAQIISNAIPSDFWPPVSDVIAQIILIENNSAGATGTVTLSNTGNFTISVNINSNFTNSGTAGFFAFGLSFSQ